jgi:hypothetical protein
MEYQMKCISGIRTWRLSDENRDVEEAVESENGHAASLFWQQFDDAAFNDHPSHFVHRVRW